MNTSAQNINHAGYQLLEQGLDWPLGTCLISPLILKIRDHGPAVLDSKQSKPDRSAFLTGQSANNGLALENAFSFAKQLTNDFRSSDVNKRMLINMFISVMLLTSSLICVGTYAWQQKSQVSYLESELLLLKAAAED